MALVAAIAFSPAWSKVTVITAEGSETVASYDESGVTYISLSELAEIVGGTLDWEQLGQKISYADGGFHFSFLIKAPFCTLNDSILNLTYPVAFRDGQLFVPALTFVPILDPVLSQKVTWNNQERSVRLESSYFNVTDLSFSPKANGLLIEVNLAAPLPYDIFVTEGSWINISFRGGVLNAARLESREDRRFLFDLKTLQEEGVAQLSLQLRRPITVWHHKLANDPPRIQISIADAKFTMDSSQAAPKIGPDKKIDAIVIDPGHGGSDYGAIGRGGTREKDVTLAIARALSDLIRKDKLFRVVMTRNSDKQLTLQERADIANNAGADLFVSIHANASPLPGAQGWNVFFLAPARNDSARAVEQLENSYFLRDASASARNDDSDSPSVADNPVVGILNEMIMTEFQAESSDLAIMMDRELRKRLDIPARGVDQAGFFVLNKVFTPSVLVESAFITNHSEEKLLKKSGFQQQLAAAIYEAVKRFKLKYESR